MGKKGNDIDFEDLDGFQNFNEEDDFEENSHQDALMLVLKGALVVLAVGIIVIIVLLYGRNADKNQEETGQMAATSDGADLIGSDMQDAEDTVLPGTDDTDADGNGSGQDGTGSADDGNVVSDGDESGTGASDISDSPMTFQDTDDTVTSKNVTNLRSNPGTKGNDTVVTQLKNGETAHRTGINADTGWSRVEYEGMTLYAVSSLLTTDVTAGSGANTGNGADTEGNMPAEAPTDTKPSQDSQPPTGSTIVNGDTVTTISGRVMTFTPCDDIISPKMEVNLRGEPSTDQGNDTIHYRMMYGETAHRTGINTDTGWSRVEYNGEVLYVVTSYIYVPEEVEAEGQ